MSRLVPPEVQAILADAAVTPDAVAGQADRLTGFLPQVRGRSRRWSAESRGVTKSRGSTTGTRPPGYSLGAESMMLTEQKIREMSARRTWVVLPAMTVAIGAMFLYFPVMGMVREPLTSMAVSRFGDTAGDITPIALILPAFAVFLLPNGLAARYVARFKTVCPVCLEDISTATGRVLSTRCCPACGERILGGGRTHSAAVYKRYQALRSRHFLRSWLWAWPVLGGLVVAWRLFDHAAFQRCPQCLWISPLVGTATAGWAWLRTFDRRLVRQLLASVALLGLGAYLFWQAL